MGVGSMSVGETAHQGFAESINCSHMYAARYNII